MVHAIPISIVVSGGKRRDLTAERNFSLSRGTYPMQRPPDNPIMRSVNWSGRVSGSNTAMDR
jgi:hypothetical protein